MPSDPEDSAAKAVMFKSGRGGRSGGGGGNWWRVKMVGIGGGN